jgi:hypothetical protein
VVTFSSLALAHIENNNNDKAFANTVKVEHENVFTGSTPKFGVVTVYDTAGAFPTDTTNPHRKHHSLGITYSSTDSAGTTVTKGLACVDFGRDANPANSGESYFTFTYDEISTIPQAFASWDNAIAEHFGGTSTNKFFKLCIIVKSTLFPYKEVAILLDNSIEFGNNRRSARQQDDDSAEDVELPATQIFLDLAPDGVLTVSFDDQQQPVISVEPNDEVVPQKEVSTTSPQLEDENNTTEQITTTLLGLIIGAVLILLVIVVIAVMMLNKRKEAAAKVYPFWMPGTDVTKTTVQA